MTPLIQTHSSFEAHTCRTPVAESVLPMSLTLLANASSLAPTKLPEGDPQPVSDLSVSVLTVKCESCIAILRVRCDAEHKSTLYWDWCARQRFENASQYPSIYRSIHSGAHSRPSVNGSHVVMCRREHGIPAGLLFRTSSKENLPSEILHQLILFHAPLNPGAGAVGVTFSQSGAQANLPAFSKLMNSL